MRISSFIYICVFMICTGTGMAAVYRVPGDFQTIQEALDACMDHDTVEVQPGTYTESLIWPDTNGITLRASVPDAMVNIRRPGTHQSLLTKTSAEHHTLILEGLDFAGANHAPGAGLYIENANLIMRHCASRNHRFSGLEDTLGLALYCVNCELAIEDCEFSGNEYEAPTPAIEVTGLAIYLEGCSGYMRQCEISDNAFSYSADIVHSLCDVNYFGNRFENNENVGSDDFRTCLRAGAGSIVVADNQFINNQANHGALMTFGNVARVTNNLFINNGNTPESRTFKPGASMNIIQFNTFAGNTWYSIGDPGFHSIVENNVIMEPMTGNWSLDHCLNYNLYGFEDPGSYPFSYGAFDIFGDPLFVTGPAGDYYLSQIASGQTENSPAADTGNPYSTAPSGTTRSDYGPDLGSPDMGFHYPATGEAPACAQPGVTIILPGSHFEPGTTFSASVDICNDLPTARDGRLYAALVCVGEVFFWPSFGTTIDYYEGTFPSGVTRMDLIPEFMWPMTTGGHTAGAMWISVLTDPNEQVIGMMDWVEFTFVY